MDGRFLNAFTLLPRQRVICGYETKPISLRHRVVLKQVGSPFSDGGVIPKPHDVLMAAKILSFSAMDEMLCSDPSESDIKWVRDMSNDVDLMIDQCERIRLCIEEQAHWPIFWSKSGGKNRDQGVPWVLSVVCNLVKNGVPLETAWTMPESQAIWMHASFSILAGSETDIVSESDRKAMEHLKEVEERMKNDPKAKPVNPRAQKALSN